MSWGISIVAVAMGIRHKDAKKSKMCNKIKSKDKQHKKNSKLYKSSKTLYIYTVYIYIEKKKNRTRKISSALNVFCQD